MLFLDEIHRFNKAQQDALLPAVEEGLVTLIGATTENPAFEVNGALLSRVRVYALQALTARGGRRGAAPGARLAGELDDGDRRRVDEEAIEFLAARAEGDARTALNALELAVATAAELGEPRVELARAEDALQRRAVLYDRKGDRHYDYISAWIKATRGSDPDASLYYLAVMLEGGEDPRFIVRRMVILASEDIGNADPAALGVAVAAAQAVEHVGLPEARYSRSRRRPSTWRWRRSPTPPAARWARPSATCASTARRRCPAWLRSGPRPGPGDRRLRLPARASRATSPRRSCCPRRSSARASTSPTRPSAGSSRGRGWSAGPPGARRGAIIGMAMSTVSHLSRAAAAPQTAARARPGDRARSSAASRPPRPEQIEQVVAAARKVQPLWALLRVRGPRALHAAHGAGDHRRVRRAARADRPRAGPAARGGRRARAAGGDRRADLDRGGGSARAGRPARGRPPLDGARQARARRV